MRLIIFVLLSLSPISLYSQYVDLEISDISFYLNDEIELEETRLLRDRYLDDEVTLSLYSDSDIVELDGLKYILDRTIPKSQVEEILTLQKTGYFGNTYRHVMEFEDQVYNDLGPVLEFQVTNTLSINKSILRNITGGEFSSKVVPSEPIEVNGKMVRYYELKIELQITDD